MFDPGENVLPAISIQNAGPEEIDLFGVEGSATRSSEVIHVRSALGLQNAVNVGNDPDEFGDRPVPFVRREFLVFPWPFQFIHDGVSRFLFPVKQEDILVQLREVLVRVRCFVCSAPE